jgi:hypothetical protein
MRKLISILFLCLPVLIPLQAQHNIVPAGGTAQGLGGQVSYTAGQLDFITKQGTGGIVTEGVQQPYSFKIVADTRQAAAELDALVYPNPSTGAVDLQIHFPLEDQLYYKLIDPVGRVLSQQRITGPVTRIDMSDLGTGTYYLTIIRDKSVLRTFQIVELH